MSGNRANDWAMLDAARCGASGPGPHPHRSRARRNPDEDVRALIQAANQNDGAAVMRLEALVRRYGASVAQVVADGVKVKGAEVLAPSSPTREAWQSLQSTVIETLAAAKRAARPPREKLPTYAEAWRRIQAELAGLGWTLSGPLAVPHATAPDGRTRVWFKAQSIYVAPSTSFKDAHSLGGGMGPDLRKQTGAQIARWAVDQADRFRDLRRENPDEEMRRLARLAAQGDHRARQQLDAYLRRTGRGGLHGQSKKLRKLVKHVAPRFRVLVDSPNADGQVVLIAGGKGAGDFFAYNIGEWSKDGPDFAYLMVDDHPGLVQEIESWLDRPGITIDWSYYNSGQHIARSAWGRRTNPSTNVKKGDRFDYFGQVWEVLKVARDRVTMARPVADAFGKEAFIDHREFHVRDLSKMKKTNPFFSRLVSAAAGGVVGGVAYEAAGRPLARRLGIVPRRRNSDEEMRRLERLAAEGDPVALRRVSAMRERSGLLAGQFKVEVGQGAGPLTQIASFDSSVDATRAAIEAARTHELVYVIGPSSTPGVPLWRRIYGEASPRRSKGVSQAPRRRNSDEDIRRLERLAAEGDPVAAQKLEATRRRLDPSGKRARFAHVLQLYKPAVLGTKYGATVYGFSDRRDGIDFEAEVFDIDPEAVLKVPGQERLGQVFVKDVVFGGPVQRRGKNPVRRNSDEDLRALEREARQGDVSALERLVNEAVRRGDRPLLQKIVSMGHPQLGIEHAMRWDDAVSKARRAVVGSSTRFIPSQEGMQIGMWKVLDTATGQAKSSGFTSKRRAIEVANEFNRTWGYPLFAEQSGRRRRNSDEDMRRLERAAQAGDPAAQARLDAAKSRVGRGPIQIQFDTFVVRVEPRATHDRVAGPATSWTIIGPAFYRGGHIDPNVPVVHGYVKGSAPEFPARPQLVQWTPGVGVRMPWHYWRELARRLGSGMRQTIGTKHISHGFYQISEASARKLAGKLPGPGMETLVQYDGESWWLARTPHQGRMVWSIRKAGKTWGSDAPRTNPRRRQNPLLALIGNPDEGKACHACRATARRRKGFIAAPFVCRFCGGRTCEHFCKAKGTLEDPRAYIATCGSCAYKRRNPDGSQARQFAMRLPGDRVLGTMPVDQAARKFRVGHQVRVGEAAFRDFHKAPPSDQAILWDDGKPGVTVGWVAGESPEVTYGGGAETVPDGSVKGDAIYVHKTDEEGRGRPTYLVGLVPPKGGNPRAPETRDFMLIGSMVAKRGWLRH